MGRFDIAKGTTPKKDTVPVQKPLQKPLQRLSRRKNLYDSPPGFPLEDYEIETATPATPSRIVVFQWPMGHRTMIPFRNLRMDISEEGELIIRVPVQEAQRITNDIEEAHRRFDPSY
jgi:hypothetical protein